MTLLHWRCVSGLALAAMLVGCSADRVQTDHPPVQRATLQRCFLPGIAEPLQCAEVRVPEVRGDAATRMIGLRVVVVPALQRSVLNDPWVELVGGPGNAATDFARQFVEDLAYARQTRDVLLVDQRGTGGSNPLYCEELAVHQLSSLPPRFPPAAVEACRARLAQHSALDHYTTAEAAEDLEDVRKALGYGPLNLFGSSYGTRVGLEYMRRYSVHVRSAMLWGVVPPHFQRPLSYARDGQAALERLVADCEGEDACGRAFPAIAEDLRVLLAHLDSLPVPITLTDPATQRELPTHITHAGVAQVIWSALAEPDRARQLPLVIHSAARGNYAPLRTLDVATRPPRRRYYNAMHLSAVCGDEVLQSTTEHIVASTNGSFMNAERGLEYREACLRWQVWPSDSSRLMAVTSGVPTLIVSGEMDPITPPRWGRAAAASLANSRHLIVPHLSHEASGLRGAACLDTLFAQFVETPDPAALRTDCIAGIRPPEFALPPGPPPR